MKTQKITLGLILLLTIGFLSSCTKYDRRAELSVDAQILEFNTDIVKRHFTIMNMGDDLLTVHAFADKEWISVTGSGVSLSHAQSSILSVQIYPELLPSYGVLNTTLQVQSNGGNFTIPIVVYNYEPLGPQLAIDLDYLKFSSGSTQDYFTLYNDGSQELNFLLESNASWLQLNQTAGVIAPGAEKQIGLTVDRTGFNAGSYTAEVSITSTGGNAVLDVDMDVAVYSVTIFNPVYTPIIINAVGFDPVQIEAGDRYSFLFVNNPQTFDYTASTTGSTDNGTPLGLEILWDELIDVSLENSPTYNLNISADYFFMAVKNTGNYVLNLWSINYGNDYQIDDDFNIPNDGVEYGVAYYDAFDDTDIYARLSGTTYDVKWSQGTEFIFPYVDNQYILLESNYKKSELKRSALKSESADSSGVKLFVKPKAKAKGSIDLYNKK